MCKRSVYICASCTNVCVYVCVCVCIYINIYFYIYREREEQKLYVISIVFVGILFDVVKKSSVQT